MLWCLHSIAQKEYNYWYFGDEAGLQFDGSSVNILTDSKMTQIEGVATISDKNGNLLFYTNGQEIYDATHNTMPNGTGLKGHNSATQGSVIVPMPGSNKLYYVITTGAIVSRTDVLSVYYSVVDISLNSGKGDVVLTKKNILIYTGTSEKCAAAYHCNGVGVWVLFHDYPDDNFRAYLLDKNGLSTTPVKSAIGLKYNSAWQRAGQVKFSHDGKRIAIAIRDEFLSGSRAQVFDFDRSTGKVTKLVATLSTGDLVHGVEFSPNDSLLYVASGSSIPPSGTGLLHQFNLFAGSGSSSDIQNSAVLLTNQSKIWFGQLQMAINGKIYLSPRNQSSLGVISNPNVKGTGCNFNLTGQSLGSKNSQLGLPNFISSVNPPQLVDFDALYKLCEGEQITLNAKSGNASYKWSDNSTKDSLVVSKSGTYWVTSTWNGCSFTDTIEIKMIPKPNGAILGPDTALCEKANYILNATTPNATYRWQDNSTQATFDAKSAGLYWVEITVDGCSNRDSINVDFKPNPPKINLGKDTIGCSFKPITLNAQTTGATYLWQDNSTNATLEATNAGEYWVQITIDGCSSKDTIKIDYVSDQPMVDLGPDSIYCKHDIIVLTVNSPGAKILWQDNSTSNTFYVQNEGKYWVKVSTICGDKSDTVVIGIHDCDFNIYYPTSFSPNKDGFNESFGPMISGLVGYDYELMVFNRWGEKLFESTVLKPRWDGTYKGELVPLGSYLWTLKLSKGTININDYGVVTMIR